MSGVVAVVVAVMQGALPGGVDDSELCGWDTGGQETRGGGWPDIKFLQPYYKEEGWTPCVCTVNFHKSKLATRSWVLIHKGGDYLKLRPPSAVVVYVDPNRPNPSAMLVAPSGNKACELDKCEHEVVIACEV